MKGLVDNLPRVFRSNSSVVGYRMTNRQGGRVHDQRNRRTAALMELAELALDLVAVPLGAADNAIVISSLEDPQIPHEFWRTPAPSLSTTPLSASIRR